jgi:DNA-binding HxlR family transcriptional regulator
MLSSLKYQIAQTILASKSQGVWDSTQLIAELGKCSGQKAYDAVKQLEEEGAVRRIPFNGEGPDAFMVRAGESLGTWVQKANTSYFLAREILEY